MKSPPTGQRHSNPPIRSWHIPPLGQLSAVQSSWLSSQRGPEVPEGTVSHSKQTGCSTLSRQRNGGFIFFQVTQLHTDLFPDLSQKCNNAVKQTPIFLY